MGYTSKTRLGGGVFDTSPLVQDARLPRLYYLFHRNDCVTSLDLSHNKISDAGVRMISKLLGQQSILTTLDLSDNRVSETSLLHQE